MQLPMLRSAGLAQWATLQLRRGILISEFNGNRVWEDGKMFMEIVCGEDEEIC